jgi:Holliday junction resolvase RusA-like endonuclease
MIHLRIPSVPPSLNSAYTTILKGRRPLRILTKDARRYKEETKAHLLQEYPAELTKFVKDRAYLLVARFQLRVQNKGWPGKAKSRYKKLDASNRLKLLEDVLAEVTDTDDSQNLVTIIQKIDSDVERTELWIWDMASEPTPFTNALFDL